MCLTTTTAASNEVQGSPSTQSSPIRVESKDGVYRLLGINQELGVYPSIVGLRAMSHPAHSLAVAPVVAVLSAFILAATRLSNRQRAKKVGQTTRRIFVFNVVRFLASLTLFGIAVASDLKLHRLEPISFLPAGVFVSCLTPTSHMDS